MKMSHHMRTLAALILLLSISGCSPAQKGATTEGTREESATQTQHHADEAHADRDLANGHEGGPPAIDAERPQRPPTAPEGATMTDREAIRRAAEEIAQQSLRDAERSDAEWREVLTEEEYRVLRQQGTERAFTGDLLDNHDHGIYTCAACGAPLFASVDKFDSGTGWPSFTQAVEEGRVEERVDRSHGMVRVEVVCARCGGHLGHVFPDGPAPTGQRYCMNSAALDFVGVEFQPPAEN